MDKMLEVIGGGVEYQQFQEELRDSLNSLGAQVCGLVLEGMDKYLMENRQERKGWVIERREDEKSILTQFGTVRYKRTYYSKKQTGENAYLVDRIAGEIVCLDSSLLLLYPRKMVVTEKFEAIARLCKVYSRG